MTEIGKAVEKANDLKGTILRLLPYWKGYKWTLLSVLLVSLIDVACTLLAPYLLGLTIDSCIAIVNDGLPVNFRSLLSMSVIIILVYLCSSAASWYQEFMMARTAQNIIKKIRNELIEKIHSLDIKFFDTQKRGILMSIFTNDAELMKDAFGITLIQMANSAITLLCTVIFMLFLNIRLTLVVCLTIPCVVFLTRFVLKNTRKHFAKQQQTLGELNGLAEENISGFNEIKNFATEDIQIKRFEDLNERLRISGTKAQIYSGILMPLMRVLENIAYIIVAVIGGLLASKGYISIGIIQSFLLYTKNFLRPINQVATQFNSVQSAIAGAERIFKLMDEKSKILNPEKITNLKPTEGIVEFDHVRFGYEKGKNIINDISFKTMPSEIVALVGATGAGKTTIINLLTRFYDSDKGTIRIDGTDIRNYSVKNVREAISIVLQEPFLFSESIKYNIAYGKPDATDEEIEKAATAANAINFIHKLPDGFNTILKENSEGVSHGQKQLLTIARALLLNRPILVLDEATSNIDTRTEILIQDALSKLMKGKTCFIIAHRLSTIKNANRIIVIQDGKIVEEGKHNELLERNNVYAKIYNSQFYSPSITT